MRAPNERAQPEPSHKSAAARAPQQRISPPLHDLAARRPRKL